MKFSDGDRVRLSMKGRDILDQPLVGSVMAFKRPGEKAGLVRVLWDGRSQPSIYADEYLERADRTIEHVERELAAWRAFAEHVEHCVECGENGVGSCHDGSTLKAATRDGKP